MDCSFLYIKNKSAVGGSVLYYITLYIILYINNILKIYYFDSFLLKLIKINAKCQKKTKTKTKLLITKKKNKNKNKKK